MEFRSFLLEGCCPTKVGFRHCARGDPACVIWSSKAGLAPRFLWFLLTHSLSSTDVDTDNGCWVIVVQSKFVDLLTGGWSELTFHSRFSLLRKIF